MTGSLASREDWTAKTVATRQSLIILNQGGVANKLIHKAFIIGLFSLRHVGMGATWVEKHGLEKKSGASTESLWQNRRNGMLSEIWEAH